MQMADVTDEQILAVARCALGNVALSIERTDRVYLIAETPRRVWVVRPSEILHDQLAFDLLP